MTHTATQADFERMLDWLLDAIGGPGQVTHAYSELVFSVWGFHLADVFGVAPARVIGALHWSLAEQQATNAGLEARVADLEIALAVRRRKLDRRSVGDLIGWTAEKTGVRAVDIRGRIRNDEAIRARMAVAWIARTVLNIGPSKIARLLGARDHSTVLHMIDRAELRRAADTAFRSLTDEMRAAFTPHAVNSTWLEKD